ncbi:UxaA family hydrolase [Caldifermentibacillus hisashii]|mgnify:CR=1 FL=1|jgi:altronate dehydratase|uniref:UxaA family hydrolase n=1 Tax=Caldifermentibacillus hisashii TaxID=996558 RepID=UPI0015960530|nr:UxaA family hydrolase [Caldifermentibacillus hisashii]
MERKTNAIVINPSDSVAVATEKLTAGDTAYYVVNGEIQEIKIVTEVPIYHKFARKDINKGEEVYKYGQSIGKAIRDIHVGEHVHTQNLVSIREGIQH